MSAMKRLALGVLTSGLVMLGLSVGPFGTEVGYAASDVALTRFFCPTGSEVGFYRIDGGGHTWPGSAFSRQVPSLGFTTLSIHATDIMWDFFARHPLRA